MSVTLDGPDFVDTATFALPPQVARMDAVRKLAARLTEVTGLGEAGAALVAQAVTDPAAVRNALNERLPGLTASRDAHLQVIPARVWTPWTIGPADDVPRYSSRKIYPAVDPSVPAWPQAEENRDGLLLDWASAADRDWHLKDNKRLYREDVYTDRLRLFPEKGGVFTPLVLAPQTETFRDGTDPLHLLRVADGMQRWYEVRNTLEQFAAWKRESLAEQFGEALTPEIFRAALGRDRAALTKLVNTVREACATEDGDEYRQRTSAHLASVLSLPAYIAVGIVDSVTGEVQPMGSDQYENVANTLGMGVHAWHCGNPAQVVATGQQTYNGLLLPEAAVDTEMIEVATKRLRVRGVPKGVIAFGEQGPAARAAARFVWWTRAARQLGGTPATAVAAFARHSGEAWPQAISRPLLAAATHMMEEDADVVYPPGDYRDDESRPDSLSLLVADAKSLTAVAALSDGGQGKLLAHPRWHNAVHIALAHLALIGALPAKAPLPEQVADNPHLLSQVAIAWANGQIAVFTRPDGAVHRDGEGRIVPIDERTLGRDDLPWPKKPWKEIDYLLPPSAEHPYDASHVFTLKHGVVYTIPKEPADQLGVEATPESIAEIVRRWFPGATGVTLTDWSDKFITGVMVGSVFVRLNDRKGEREDARHRGVWYPDGRPAGTKDLLDFEATDSGMPDGIILEGADFLADGFTTTWFADITETILAEELYDAIDQQVDDALEAQKAADAKKGGTVSERHVPVLRLPELKGHKV